MHWQFNFYEVILLVTTIISLWLSLFIWKRRSEKGGTYFSFMMLAAAIWAFAGIFEMAVIEPQYKVLFSKISYIGILSSIPCWYLFTYNYTQLRPLAQKYQLLIWGLSIVMFILTWTNEFHGLIWPQMIPKKTSMGEVLIYKHGFVLWMYVVFSYILLLIGSILLIRFAIYHSELYTGQVVSIVIGSIFPYIGNYIYMFGHAPFAGVDLTPICFLFSGIFFIIGVFRFQLLRSIPIAHGYLFANMDIGVLVLDTRDRIIEVNPAAMSFIGEKDILGKKLADIQPELYKQVIKNEEVKNITPLLSKKDGENIWLGYRTKLLYKNKAPYCRIILFNDITKEKKIADEISKSEKRFRELDNIKNKLFSIVAHDLKSPFQGLLGLSNLIIEDYEKLNPEEIHMCNLEINRSIKNLYKLLEHLLEWSRVQASGISIEKKTLNVYDEINKTIDTLRSFAENKNIELIVKAEKHLTVNMDTDSLQILLRNLISNAVKFSNHGSSITITAERSDNVVNFSVADKGIGVPKESIPELFNMDSHYTTKGTENESGTGLGLVLCKEIVDKYNGNISVKSEVGKGTTFTFTIPD